MVAEATANARGRIRAMFVEENSLDRFAVLLEAAPEKERYVVPEHILASISQVKTPQGIAAVVELPAEIELQTLGDRVILLENVQDPGNVGTVLRTADAAGFSACVLTPGCADPFSPKALRATMGSIFRVPCAQASSAAEAAETMKKQGYAVLATTLDGNDFFKRSPLPPKVCVMIGNEGAGLTPEACAVATHRYSLPMRGGAESLNAAVAAAVFMYELTNRE